MSEAASYPALSLYIDGKFIGSAEREGEDVVNPADGGIVGHLPHARAEDLDAALTAASAAFDRGRGSSPRERSRILRRVAELIRDRADAIARNLTLDQGKPLAEARAEVFGAAEHAEWHAEECRRIYGRVIPPRNADVRQTVIRQPVGVCELPVQPVSPQDLGRLGIRMHAGPEGRRGSAERCRCPRRPVR